MTASKIGIHKVCEYCEKTFVAWKSTTRFCSKTCNSKAYNQLRREQRIVAIENETNTRPIEKIKNKTNWRPRRWKSYWDCLHVKSFVDLPEAWWIVHPANGLQQPVSKNISHSIAPAILTPHCRLPLAQIFIRSARCLFTRMSPQRKYMPTLWMTRNVRLSTGFLWNKLFWVFYKPKFIVED